MYANYVIHIWLKISHNLGYHALLWETILHGNAGEMGKYAVLSVLPDKIILKLPVFCMNTMIHCTPLWPCLRFPWTGVMSVFTASSNQIRYYEYEEKNVLYT